MGANWGLFLCNCRQSLPLDPDQLIFPTAPSVFSFVSDPEKDFPDFGARVRHESPDRVLVGCCAPQSLFHEALEDSRLKAPKIHFLNLREACFRVHTDPEQAHAKATRLLRAAMEAAEAESELDYNPLKVGNRVLVGIGSPQGMRLVERLRDLVQPTWVVPSSHSHEQGKFTGTVYSGRVVEVTGRLGNFRVVVEEDRGEGAKRHELQADQVVIVAQKETNGFKPRTGCYVIHDPSEAELELLLERIRDHMGEFLKPVQVAYNAGICAGGSANQEACGRCIPACPYDAISRDPENHLRVKVDPMSCEGCGACVSACPTTALRFTEPSPRELYARMAALLAPVVRTNGERSTLLFHCGEQGKRVLEEAGRQPLVYPASVLPIEVPCLRYVSEANMLAAFRLGAAGVGLLGCERCQHGERELLYQKFDFCRLTLDAFGLGPERLRLITAEEGTEAEAIAALSGFAQELPATPIRWDGRTMRHWGNREVIEEEIATFIEQTGQEPGLRPLEASQPFAFAEVKESGCTMCRSCVNVCPTHAFRIEESTSSLQFKHIACVACGLCERACPENVITLRREIFFERDALNYQTVAEDAMVGCTKCGKPYINRKALETVEARVFSLESLLDTFSGQRRNLLRMCPDCRAVAAMLEVEKGWKP